MSEFKKAITSWIAIVIAFVAFWPIGFVLLYHRLYENDGKYKANGIFLILAAAFCAIISIVGITNIGEDEEFDLQFEIAIISIFLVLTAVATLFAVKNLMKHKKCQKYIDYIVAKKKTTIEELCEITGENIETSMKIVTGIIKNKMIDAYINENNEVIMNIKNNTVNSYTTTVQQEYKKPITHTVECKNCGATNKYIEGQENRCEYCDTIL